MHSGSFNYSDGINIQFYIINDHQGGSGSASNIKFQNIEMYNVSNPIIIDQNYCDQDKPCEEQVIKKYKNCLFISTKE